jgi:hypothetical protein
MAISYTGSKRIFSAHAGTRVHIGLTTIRLVRDIKIGSETVKAGTVGSFLEADEEKSRARCWFVASGTWVALDDLEPSS